MKQKMRLFILLPLLYLLVLPSLQAQDNETCMECHNDDTLEKTLAEGTIKSMFVNDSLFHLSVNEDVECISCHTELDDFEDFPHEENLDKVDCASCHDDITSDYMGSLHGKALSIGNPRSTDLC